MMTDITKEVPTIVNPQPKNEALSPEERKELNRLVIYVEGLALKVMKAKLSGDLYKKITRKWVDDKGLTQQTRELIKEELIGEDGEFLTVNKTQLADLAQKVYDEIFKPIIDEELQTA